MHIDPPIFKVIHFTNIWETPYLWSIIIMAFWRDRKIWNCSCLRTINRQNNKCGSWKKYIPLHIFKGNCSYSESKDKTMFLFAHKEAVISKPEVNKLLRNQSNYMYVWSGWRGALHFGQKTRVFSTFEQLEGLGNQAT